MKLLPALLPLAALALIPGATRAQDDIKKAAQGNATRDYIASANKGGIRDWRAGGYDLIYFQDRSGQWFRAELNGQAPELGWSGFVTVDSASGDRLDKSSAVYIGGERYVLKSFAPVDSPRAFTLHREDNAKKG